MFSDLQPPRTRGRRDFLRLAGWLGLGGIVGASGWRLRAAEAPNTNTLTLPFENGERPLVSYPQKRPLLRLTSRPPQLETPFTVFNEGTLTPNDAFFVRYHLTLSPPAVELLGPEKFRVGLKGKLRTPLSFSLAELQSQFEP